MRFFGCFVVLAALAVVCAASTAKATQMYALSTLVAFNGTNGQDVYSGLTADSSGNLYGTTALGGAIGQGTVFEIAAGTHAFSTIVTFNLTNGLSPKGTLIADSSGNLYGTTAEGGSGSNGEVYKVAAGTHALSTIATFSGAGNPVQPVVGVVVDSSGNLYGTSEGGAVGYGAVYEIPAHSSSITTLASFTNTNSNGVFPMGGLLLDSSGNLYGTTTEGGVNGDGNVFKVAAGTHTLTNLFSFDVTNGAFPYGSLISDSSGNLYGTTDAGGSGYGTVFKLNPTTDILTTPFTFDGTNGEEPRAGLIFGPNGDLFGTTYMGGANDEGTVFELNPTTGVLTDLVSFNLGSTSPQNPLAGVIFDSSGNLYGTTLSGGGVSGDGAVFELSPVPEPSSIMLLLSALCGLAIAIRAKKGSRPAAAR